MDTNKTTADEASLINICSVCGKKTSNRLVIQNMFYSVNDRMMMQLQMMKSINLLMTPRLLLHLNWPMVSF